MSFRAGVLVLATPVAVLLLAGCGSSGSRPAATRTTAPTSASSVLTVTAPHPPANTSTIAPSNGAATAFLPATYTIEADGSVSPPLISGPAATAILLTIDSRAPHPVSLELAGHAVSVAPGSRVSARIVGLRVGRYVVRVDGIARGALVIGAQPGP